MSPLSRSRSFASEPETEKIEVIRILYDLLSEFGLRRRKSSVEIRNSLALPVEEIAFNLVNEDVPTPAVLNGLLRVPNALSQILQFVQNRAVMEPWQLCSNLLHKVLVRPSLGKSPHIFKISWRKTAHLRKRTAKIRGKPIDHFASPA